ncbi:MAG: nitrogenase cofactor biosynthesis protein NifB [Deltaproteobacteria bacterium]|nr:nitrogenase cofactor biosynthesis protein NifB [Deltaproteobacteria bacterium]
MRTQNGRGQAPPLLTRHPCFSEDASKRFGRIHLPVAPKCNISCNYCSRKYDCANESRPGVTSKILLPEEAVERFLQAMKAMPYISTVGIAGPGDSLANPEKTFNTLELVRSVSASLHICLSTNGLMLADYADELLRLKVGYITVTVNSTDVAIAEKIYRWVRFRGKNYYGQEGATLLLERQREGLLKLKGKGIFLKINILYIPGVNDSHIQTVAQQAKEMGAHLVNVMPLIPAPGSAFEKIKRPEQVELEKMQIAVGSEIETMKHCRQCRSDAAGMLGKESVKELKCQSIKTKT